MDSNNSPIENDDISYRNWNKLREKAVKIGLREGLSDGRDSVFQNGFDQGFTKGLQTGLKLGEYNGMLSVLKRSNEIISLTEDDKSVLENMNLITTAPKGFCQICENSNLLTKPLSETLKCQDTYNDLIFKDINPQMEHFITLN